MRHPRSQDPILRVFGEIASLAGVAGGARTRNRAYPKVNHTVQEGGFVLCVFCFFYMTRFDLFLEKRVL